MPDNILKELIEKNCSSEIINFITENSKYLNFGSIVSVSIGKYTETITLIQKDTVPFIYIFQNSLSGLLEPELTILTFKEIEDLYNKLK